MSLSSLIQDQMELNSKLEKLDRNIFYLPHPVSYEDYIQRLAGKEYTEERMELRNYDDDVIITIKQVITIPWKELIPSFWHRMNPYIEMESEKTARLETKFTKAKKMDYQSLIFSNSHSASNLFSLFIDNSNWEKTKSIDSKIIAKSKDGVHTIWLQASKCYGDFDTPKFSLFLSYKK